MPSWAIGTLLTALAMLGGLLLTAWRFGSTAGAMSKQMDILTASIKSFGDEFKADSKEFRAGLQTMQRQLAVLEQRLAYVEEDRRFRRTPPGGVPSIGGSPDGG